MNFQAFFTIFSLIGSIYGILITGLIASRLAKSSIAQHLLFGIFLNITLVMLLITVVNAGWLKGFHWLDVLEKVLTLTIGPIIFAFVSARIQATKSIPRTFWLHFSPAILYLLLAVIGYQWQFLYNMLHFQMYVIGTIFLYFKYYQKPLNKKNQSVDWIPLLFTFLIIVCAAQWLRLSLKTLPSLRLIVPFVSSFSFQFILFTGFRHSTLLKNNDFAPGKSISLDFTTPKLKMLDQLMEKQKLYQNSDLTLGQLATLLEIHPNQLSQLLNQHLKTNFSDYLNTYRIEKAKELLANPDKSNLTIAALAEEAGFKSRSAFYQAFKKRTGLTPTAYQNCL